MLQWRRSRWQQKKSLKKLLKKFQKSFKKDLTSKKTVCYNGGVAVGN